MHQHTWHAKSGTIKLAGIVGASLIVACWTAFLGPAGNSEAKMLASDSLNSFSTPSVASQQPASSSPASIALRLDPSSRGGSRSARPDISTPEKFIAVVAEAARDSQMSTRVPASVTIAQAILESDWGKSQLSSKALNFFGIKAQRGPGPAGIIMMDTWEVLSGANNVVNDAFRAYHNIFESVDDHGRFLHDNPRYAAAFKVANDAREFARRIHAAGYATDPNYSAKLIKLMDKYNLYQYDLPTP